MPRVKWIDKKSAAHFNLVHRPQNDPFIHDDAVPSMVLRQVAPPNSHKPGKPKTLVDLEHELDLPSGGGGVRDNEGEAANYGIYYDDTEYDYMQHLRELGGAGTEVGFVDAMPVKYKGKGKAKVMKLEDALRESSLDDIKSDSGSIAVSQAGTSSTLGDDFLPSQNLQRTTYQDQQDVPDILAGFQPDMDMRLREVLEALDDDAYVDDQDDEDIFGSLVEGGRADEITFEEFEDTTAFDDEDAWESDTTEKPAGDHPQANDLPEDSIDDGHVHSITDEKADPAREFGVRSTLPEEGPSFIPQPSAGDGAWLAEFSKFKQANKTAHAAKPKLPPASSLNTTSTNFKPVKKRKGALTDSSSYSMTSSSLSRTDGLRLLDDRFDRIEALYSVNEEEDSADDEDGGISVAPSTSSRLSKASGVSATPSLIEAQTNGALRTDFDSMMDDFLSGFPGTKSGKGMQAATIGRSKRERREGRYKNGMRMLDEVRGDLGPARIRGQV